MPAKTKLVAAELFLLMAAIVAVLGAWGFFRFMWFLSHFKLPR